MVLDAEATDESLGGLFAGALVSVNVSGRGGGINMRSFIFFNKLAILRIFST